MSLTRPEVVLIAAVARNGVIGTGSDMPWRLPEDLQHLKRSTLGHPVVMGRKTWDSLPQRFRPLPGRRNIVVSRNDAWQADGAERAASLGDALELVKAAPRVFVIGGAQLYEQALGLADELLLTEIDRDFEGETRFPPLPPGRFRCTAREAHHAAPPNDFGFAFVTYRRDGC